MTYFFSKMNNGNRIFLILQVLTTFNKQKMSANNVEKLGKFQTFDHGRNVRRSQLYSLFIILLLIIIVVRKVFLF